ncbi:nitrite reductase [Nocardiopsis coralliicola]
MPARDACADSAAEPAPEPHSGAPRSAAPAAAAEGGPVSAAAQRTRPDRCPGALRPWAADDGLLVRLRLVGGRLPVASLRALAQVAETHGSGRIHLTLRANLQVRGLPAGDGPGAAVAAGALRAIEATGLLPSRSHELVRNIMSSPLSGFSGGRADLRAAAAQLDALLCGAPHRAQLPGRFLFVLDDGRGDLLDRPCDLGLAALDGDTAQLRVGDGYGPVVPLADAPGELVRLVDVFLEQRGTGAGAAWHAAELATHLAAPAAPDPRLPEAAPPLPFGPVPGGGRHVAVPDGGLTRAGAESVAAEAAGAGAASVVVTPWRGIFIPGGPR